MSTPRLNLSSFIDRTTSAYENQCGNFELTCDIFNDLASDDDDNDKNNSTNEVVDFDNASTMEQDRDGQGDMIIDNDDGKYYGCQRIKLYEQPLKDSVTTAQTRKHSESIFDEVDLSQKMSQLSGSLKQKKAISYVELDLRELIGIDVDQVPNYLYRTNECFGKLIYSIRPKIMKNDLEQLRHIAIIMYKLLLLEKLQSLWTMYRKSGMGELEMPQHIKQFRMKIWPVDVRSHIRQFETSLMQSDDDTCRLFVDHCLKTLYDKSQEYHNQLRYQTSHMIDYASSMEQTIEKFVQQRFMYQSLEYDCQIELVQYHYINGILKRQYFNENPNEKQIQLFKCLCKFKYEEAITKYELKYLQERMPENSTSNSFQNQSSGKISIIDRIHDVIMREKLYQEYTAVAEQAKTDIMTLSIETLEEQLRQCQKRLNTEMNQMWQNEKMLPSNQRLTPPMVHLMEQRLANIDTRLACIQKYKFQLSKIQNKTP